MDLIEFGSLESIVILTIKKEKKDKFKQKQRCGRSNNAHSI